MLPSFIKSKNTKKIFLDSVLFLFFSIIPYLIFKKVENLFTPSTIQEISGDYDSLFKAYVGVIKDFFLGKNNFFISLKVIGNHIIYLFFSTFFLPFLFIINDFVEFVKSKKIKGELIFVLTSSLLFFIPSYLHDYLGFFRNEIKYSTYFRYADASIIIMIAYSLIRLFEVTKNKLKIYKNSYFLYFFISMILTLFLPVRDFYVTINSLGWTWLDIFKQNALIIKIISLLLLSIFLFFIKYKKYNLFLLSIIILNLFSIFPILKMNTWLSTNKENLALEHTISNILSNNKKIPFYIDKNNTKDDSFVGPIYYGKYFLLFNSNEKIPIKPINIKELNGKKQFVFLGKSKDDIFNIYNFNEVISISENLKIGIIYENK